MNEQTNETLSAKELEDIKRGLKRWPDALLEHTSSGISMEIGDLRRIHNAGGANYAVDIEACYTLFIALEAELAKR